MAHDVIARYKNSGERICHITIESHDQGDSWILYESLNCSKFNSGVSGNGCSAFFSEDELKISLSKFNYLSGEPIDELTHTINTSAPCKKARNIFSRVLSSIGIRGSHNKTNTNINSFNEIEKFLISIQNKGDVIIDFT